MISPYDDLMVLPSSTPPPEPGSAIGELSERDAEILAFERQWWKYAGAKEQAIRDKFQMSATRYYQVLNALIDKPEALAQDPLLVKRLRRLRATRQRFRRRSGSGSTSRSTDSPLRLRVCPFRSLATRLSAALYALAERADRLVGVAAAGQPGLPLEEVARGPVSGPQHRPEQEHPVDG